VTSAEFKDFVFAGCQVAVTVSVVYGAFYVKKLEKNTNSIKDELVKVTGDKAFLEGKADERQNPS
jgi:large-conductance mechanosensitive channel